jgi:hypothetical protein
MQCETHEASIQDLSAVLALHVSNAEASVSQMGVVQEARDKENPTCRRRSEAQTCTTSAQLYAVITWKQLPTKWIWRHKKKTMIVGHN